MRSAAFIVAMLVVVVVAAPAMAQTDTIVIEIDGVTRGAQGSITTVAELAVDPDKVGAVCSANARTGNNASEHPNNDFILSSGTSSSVIPDWEREAGATVGMETTLTLGDTITVAVRLGPSEVSSGMVVITMSCAQPPPPTTTTTTTTTAPPPTSGVSSGGVLIVLSCAQPEPPVTQPPVTEPPVTQPPVTDPPPTTTPGTTEAPPEGGVSAGGGATAGGVSEAAVLWLTGGALALLSGATVLAMRRATGRE